MTEMQKLMDFAEMTVADLGRNMRALTEAFFPGAKEAREAAARIGYVGNRFGWYPEKPKRTRRRLT